MNTIWTHVIISGNVQGVCFRDATQRAARELGVSGWVRNLPSGQVEATFSGSAQAVEQLVEFVKKGPPLARVDDVQISQSETGESYSGFRIVR